MLTIPVKTKNIGNIPVGVPYTIEYDITNNTADPIEVGNIIPGCGCTDATILHNPIPSGVTSKFSCVFNAAARGQFFKGPSFQETLSKETHNFKFSGKVV